MYLHVGGETNAAGLFEVNLSDLAQLAKLDSKDEAVENLKELQEHGFIEYDPERCLVYVKNLTTTNNYHMNELVGNSKSILKSLRDSRGSPLVKSYYDDHKKLLGSKVLQNVFTQLKNDKIISD